MASGVAIMLAMTAMAQDSPRLRTPRKAPQGTIQRINPADIAAAAVFLASEEAGWITGVILPVDGGMLAT